MTKPICIISLMILCLSACATTSSTATHVERKHYGQWELPLGYTQVVRHGNTLYLSGIGNTGATLREQLEGIYRTTGKILSDYKATPAEIVKEVIYTTDIISLEKANAVRTQFYNNGQYPSSSWVQVQRLLGADMQVEVEFIVQLQH
ncbi:MAG TPA: RidA family protein [Cellvibrionaceae bacterium]